MFSSSVIVPTSLPTITRPVNIFSYLTFLSFIHHLPFTYLCPSNHQSIKGSMIYPTSHPSTNSYTHLPTPLPSTHPPYLPTFPPFYQFLHPLQNPSVNTISSTHLPTPQFNPYICQPLLHLIFLLPTHHSLFIFQTTLSIHQLFHPSSFICQPLPLPPTPHLLSPLSLPKSFIHPPKYPTPLNIYYPSLLTHTSTLPFMGLSFLHL